MKYNLKFLLQVGNIIAVFLTIIVNALANILPINNKLTGDISDSIPNLFVPAGITFSIWGVIYILLIVFAFYQARDLFSKNKIEMPFINKISFYLIIASIANIAWIFLWHYEQIALSLIPMIILFISLLLIYFRLNIGKVTAHIKEELFVYVPFSVYIGWITVATIANVTAVLVTIGWDGFGICEYFWTILVLIVASFITILILVLRFDVAYSLVIIWAFLGIVIKRINPDVRYGVQNEIATVAFILIIAIAITILINYIRRKSIIKKEKMEIKD